MNEIKNLIAAVLPDYDFDNVVHYTYQGKDCKYHEKYPALFSTKPRALADENNERAYDWSSLFNQASVNISTTATLLISYLVLLS